MARRSDEGTGQWREINCDHRDCPWYREGQCQEIGNLQLVLPRVSMRGVYQIDTSSFYGMNAVYDEWEFFSGIFVAHTGAPEALPSVPFKLVRRMEQIEYWDGREGKRRTTSHPILHLVAPDWRIDDLLTTVSIEQNGKPESVVVNFPLHPAILDYENYLYTADYPGYLAEAMSKMFSKDFETIFFNGCCGYINHIDHNNDHNNNRHHNHYRQTNCQDSWD